MEDLIKEDVDKFESQKIKVIHVEVDKRECFDTIRELDMRARPTCQFHEKGKETGRRITFFNVLLLMSY